MADEVLEIRRMTVDEVKANPPKIDKKFVLINSSLYTEEFVLINSSLYTDEAFEYVLELVNETDCVLFIRDTRQIYTHGEYFGGDIWEDRLFFFGGFQLVNDSEEEISKIQSELVNETLRIKGINNITLTSEEYYSHGDKIKTLVIGYDIANAVDTSVVTIDDPTAQYNLEIKDEKIAINKYIPVRVELRTESKLFEYDSEQEGVIINLDIYGTSENKHIWASSSTNENMLFSDDYKVLRCTIQQNANSNYLILYSDEKTQGSIMFTQNWGYAVCWGNEEITDTNFGDFERVVLSDSCKSDFFITQEEGEYGWFACPSTCKPVFIDRYSGLRGGWQKYSEITVYSLGMEYTVWRTENSGLGENRWSVEEYKK